MRYDLNLQRLTDILGQMDNTLESCCKLLVLAGVDMVFAEFTETDQPEYELKHIDLLADINSEDIAMTGHNVAYAGQMIRIQRANRVMLIDSGSSLPEDLVSVDVNARQRAVECIGQLILSIDPTIDFRH